MICGFCDTEFDEDRGQPGCRACPLGSDCGLVRCPRCGYENPATPKVVSFLKGLMRRKSESSPHTSTGIRSLPVLPVSEVPEGGAT